MNNDFSYYSIYIFYNNNYYYIYRVLYKINDKINQNLVKIKSIIL